MPDKKVKMSEDHLKELRDDRSILKGQITRIENYANSSNADLDLLRERSITLDDLFRRFSRIQDALDQATKQMGAVGADTLEAEEAYRLDVENKFYRTKAVIRTRLPHDNTDRISNLEASIQSLVEQQSAFTNTITTAFSHSPASNVVSSTPITSQQTFLTEPKLPTLQPTFDGNYERWPEFKNLFDSIIHNNRRLDAVLKFQYLKGALTGTSANDLNNWTITGDNYQAAYDFLDQKYNKENVITEIYMSKIINSPSVTSSCSMSLQTLLTRVDESLRALKAMQFETDKWDLWLNYVVLSKVDEESRRLWRRETAEVNRPTFLQMQTFLRKRIFEMSSTFSSTKPAATTPVKQSYTKRSSQSVHMTTETVCRLCKGKHEFTVCSKFVEMSIDERKDLVREQRLCFNCFGKHISRFCKAARCGVCQRRHNVLLHQDVVDESKGDLGKSDKEKQKDPLASDKSVCAVLNDTIEHSRNVLPTVLFLVKDCNKQYQLVRGLWDSCATINLITDACVKRLGLQLHNNNHKFTTAGGASQSAKGYVHLTIKSRNQSYVRSAEASIVDVITSSLSRVPVDRRLLQGKVLADDVILEAEGDVDILLANDITLETFTGEMVRIGEGSMSPFAISTVFGWIVAGRVSDNQNEQAFVTTEGVNEILHKIWEIDDVGDICPKFTLDEEFCEHYYKTTTRRLSDGRYQVALPFKTSGNLGNSKSSAISRLYSLEYKFRKNPKLKAEYCKVMKEYFELNHLQPLTEEDKKVSEWKSYYLPHHPVMKTDSSTTKMRIVFDASAKTSSGVSLNQKLFPGPAIQNNLIDIILNFRRYKIAYCADIARMYREVAVLPKDSHFQRIVWRFNENDNIGEYKLSRVTFGVSAAPWLAMRTLQQLANDYETKFPLATQKLRHHFYVDNLMGGDHSLEEALTSQKDLIALLDLAQFNLRKWGSNSASMLEHLDDAMKELTNHAISEDSSIKNLGLRWNSSEDFFHFKVNQSLDHSPTRRNVMSEIARIYDPLGWLSPVVITAKILIQDLWLAGAKWDDLLPQDLLKVWMQFRKGLPTLEKVQIPRWVNTSHDLSNVELVGFCDASLKAYGAVIYVRVLCGETWRSTLLFSKTKVAPIRTQLSVPRLELCGAYLLTKLFVKVLEIYKVPLENCYAFTDSTVVLSWLKEHPRVWKSFVGNRTTAILSHLPYERWHYVRTNLNPADVITKGIAPNKLQGFKLWWSGPPFIAHPNMQKFFVTPQASKCNKERKVQFVAMITNGTDSKEFQWELINKFSSFYKLVRVVAWMTRPLQNVRRRMQSLATICGPLTASEIDDAFQTLVKFEQERTFSKEVLTLASSRFVQQGSIAKLSPFLDDAGVMRVGGRLQNAPLDFISKHPMILHKSSPLTTLLVRQFHKRYHHAGPQLLECLLRYKYWIVGAYDAIINVTQNCVRCQRQASQGLRQQMGSLPVERFFIGKPFSITGIDYAGPLQLATKRGRGAKHFKGYIAVFVCMSTRALHLELVTDLTGSAVIAAMRRFLSRRGAIHKIMSDNGTNFLAASKEIKRLFTLSQKSSEVQNYMSTEGITWDFIPPYSPNFGGRWESSVKQVKYHLKRVTDGAALTYEEMSTLLCEIEHTLNSRPLTVTSCNIKDLEPLTPIHLLTGGPPKDIPDPDFTSRKHLDRWEYVQSLHQTFWKRWSTEYITKLQQKNKWLRPTKNLKINDVVLVKDSNLGTNKWNLGTIHAVYPGKDKLVRVADVNTKSGIIRRSVSSLAFLFSVDD